MTPHLNCLAHVTYQNYLAEVVLMDGHNMCVREEKILKTILMAPCSLVHSIP